MPNREPQPPVQTPVAVFLFNRPAHTRALFDALRPVQPRRLFIIADGPRPQVAGEAERCAAARAVFDAVDWECDITTNFAPANLGLKERVDSGLTWVLDQVERAIILEDDCLPSRDFFPFCETLLERYADEEQIFSVGGCQYFPGQSQSESSYYFSRYPMVWGWGTWRRAWQQHDPDLPDWPAARDSGWLSQYLDNADAVRYWSYILERVYRSHHTWDFGWAFSGWRRGALHIHSRANLVRNTGFGAGATHTTDTNDPRANLKWEPLEWPLRHPARIVRDTALDDMLERREFGGNIRRFLTQARQWARAATGPQEA